MKRVVVKKRDGRRIVDQRGMKEFMSAADVFLKHRAQTLTSFVVMFQIEDHYRWNICRVSKDNGLRMPYHAFFQCVLGLLESDEYTESLQLCLEFGFRQPVHYENENLWSERTFWKQLGRHCPLASNDKVDEEELLRGSEDIMQLICEILEKSKRNIRGDKLIVNCFGMEVPTDCAEFLKFWFQNQDIEVDHWTIRLSLLSNDCKV